MSEWITTAGGVLVALWVGLLVMLTFAFVREFSGGDTDGCDEPETSFSLCPGCEDLKPMRPGMVLCDGCWRVLPRLIQIRLMDGYLAERDGDGPAALISAMTVVRRYLGERRTATQPAPRA